MSFLSFLVVGNHAIIGFAEICRTSLRSHFFSSTPGKMYVISILCDPQRRGWYRVWKIKRLLSDVNSVADMSSCYCFYWSVSCYNCGSHANDFQLAALRVTEGLHFYTASAVCCTCPGMTACVHSQRGRKHAPPVHLQCVWELPRILYRAYLTFFYSPLLFRAKHPFFLFVFAQLKVFADATMSFKPTERHLFISWDTFHLVSFDVIVYMSR